MKRIAMIGAIGWALGMWSMLFSSWIQSTKGFRIGTCIMFAGCAFMAVEYICAALKSRLDRQRVR